MFFHHNHVLCPVYREWNRITVQHIAITGLHLNQLILAVGKLIRKHQPAFLIGKESVNGNRCRIINSFCNQVACRQIAYLESNTGCRNDFPCFSIVLFYTDKAGLGCIVQNIGIGLVICTDVNDKVRDKCLAFHALSLMYDITAIREILGNSKSVCIRSQNIAFVFSCRIIAACTGKINLEFGAFLRLLNNPLLPGSFDIFRRNRNRYMSIRIRLCFRNTLRIRIFYCFFCS